MNNCYILLGGNQGNRLKNLEDARTSIARLGEIVEASGIYQTAAWGKTDQPDFLNQVIVLKTKLPPAELMNALLGIETGMGRQRKEKYDPRTIDLDILYYGERVVDQPGLSIPHPRIPERRFVLEPLNEIAPNFVHPVLMVTNHQLLADCSDRLPVEKLIFSTTG